MVVLCGFFFQAEDGIRDLVRSRGLGDVYKRQDEVSGARVGIHFDDQEWEVVADNEGYFTHSLPLARPVEKTDAWYAVQLHLLEPALGEPLPYAEAQVLVPPPTARYGVISDIDDTILETNATSLLRSALVTLLENCLLYTSPSPRDRTRSRMPSSA